MNKITNTLFGIFITSTITSIVFSVATIIFVFLFLHFYNIQKTQNETNNKLTKHITELYENDLYNIKITENVSQRELDLMMSYRFLLERNIQLSSNVEMLAKQVKELKSKDDIEPHWNSQPEPNWTNPSKNNDLWDLTNRATCFPNKDTWFFR